MFVLAIQYVLVCSISTDHIMNKRKSYLLYIAVYRKNKYTDKNNYMVFKYFTMY